MASAVEAMFKDYAKFTEIEFAYGDKTKGEDAYFSDLVTRATRGGSGRNRKNIDLIVVADQLLTGYDSKFLNTLYVDRPLELQGLIQAYSRTNRVYGKDKEFGTIVNFKYPAITEELADTALKLYGSGGKSSRVIVDHYQTAVHKLALKVQEMVPTLPKPTDWALLKADDEAKQLFLLSFRDANDQLRLVMQYYEFKWDDASFGIDEHTWLQYVGAYKNLTFSDVNPTDEIIRPLVGKTKLSGTQVIDAHHILSLIGAKVKTDKGVQTVDSETLRIIHEEIQELSDMGEAEQAKLLKEFVDTELVSGNLPSDLSFDESFEAWKQRKVALEVKKFAEQWGLDEHLLSNSLAHFSIVRGNVIPFIDELSRTLDFVVAANESAGNRLEHVITLVEHELPDWMIEMKRKYG